MRTSNLAIAAVLAAAALSASAAGPRMEGDIGPFTYEAVGATPSLAFGRAKAAVAPTVEAPRPAVAKRAAPVTDRAARAGTASTASTYDALGATPRVETTKAAGTEAVALPAR